MLADESLIAVKEKGGKKRKVAVIEKICLLDFLDIHQMALTPIVKVVDLYVFDFIRLDRMEVLSLDCSLDIDMICSRTVSASNGWTIRMKIIRSIPNIQSSLFDLYIVIIMPAFLHKFGEHLQK